MIPIPSRDGAWIGSAALTLIAATLPAAINWWTDRRLLGKGDDPALPELLASRRRVNLRAMAIGFAFVIVLGGGNAAWGIPLLVALLIAAAYPIRTRLLGETWPFGAYLGHTALSVAGGFGFWILLGYAPSLVQRVLDAFGAERWPVVAVLAVGLAAVLFAVEEWYPRIWLWTHAATPLDDPALTPRFAEIVNRARTIAPRVYRVGPAGSRFVNAVALPSVRRPAVAMGNALLDLLEPDETVAIFAHEIAHFDHFTPKRIARSQLINRVLIVLGVSLPFLTTFLLDGGMRWIGWVWPVVVLVALARRAAKSQQHETESDLRAAALCGDPEALVRGLVKLHLHARIPRRYAVDVERAASHPSLLRRIQAIRGAAATAAEQLDAATVVRSTRAGRWVVLDGDRAYWLDGVPEGVAADLASLRDAATSYRAVNYADLVELRVNAAGESRALTARVKGGDMWSIPIASADVARVQRALDIVDLRLGKVAAGAPPPAIPKLAALGALIAAMITGQLTLLLVPIVIALWKPNAAALAALGAMSVVRAMLGVLEGSTWLDENTARFGLVALAIVGVVAIYASIRLARADEGTRHVRLTITVLGGLAVLIAISSGVVGLVGGPLLPAFGTIVIGLAAALFFLPVRWIRPAAFSGLAAGVALVTLGADRTALSLRNALTEVTARATLVSETDVGTAAYGLRVSPSGSHFLAMQSPVGRRGTARRRTVLLIGRFGGASREVSAVDGDFVDDRRVLVVDALEHGMELRLEPVDSGAAPVWADTLADADYIDTRLIIDRDNGTWAFVGEDADDDRTRVLVGRIGERGSSRRAAIPDTIVMVGEPIVFDQGNTVIVPTYVNVMRGRTSALWALPLLGMDPLRSELWRVRGDSLKRIASIRGVPECGAPVGGIAACAARHVRATSLYTIDANGVAVEVAQLASHNLGVVVVGPGTRAASMRFDHSIQLIDLARCRLTTIPLGPRSDYASEVRAGPGYAVTLSHNQNRRATVRLYRIE